MHTLNGGFLLLTRSCVVNAVTTYHASCVDLDKNEVAFVQQKEPIAAGQILSILGSEGELTDVEQSW